MHFFNYSTTRALPVECQKLSLPDSVNATVNSFTLQPLHRSTFNGISRDPFAAALTGDTGSLHLSADGSATTCSNAGFIHYRLLLAKQQCTGSKSIAHWLTNASPPRVFSCVSSWNMRYATYDDLSMGPRGGVEQRACVAGGRAGRGGRAGGGRGEAQRLAKLDEGMRATEE